MKLLIIIVSHSFDSKWCDAIKILNEYMKLLNMDVEYCGISNQDDFYNYETIISFKYKIINTENQIVKLHDFITDYRSELDYTWYMKIRPDIKLLENINFDILSQNAVNARARKYRGPLKIKYGMSVNGQGCWRNIGDCYYSDREEMIELDDMLQIFHKNIIELNAFDKVILNISYSNEMVQNDIFINRKIPLNVIGINLVNLKHNCFSGDLNMS